MKFSDSLSEDLGKLTCNRKTSVKRDQRNTGETEYNFFFSKLGLKILRYPWFTEILFLKPNYKFNSDI